MQLMPESEVAPAGVPRSTQCAPPSVVPMTWAPEAKQLMSLGHAIASSGPVYPLGTDCEVQVWPPFVVVRMAAPGPGDAEPIAVQCVVSAHAMAVKSLTVDGVASIVHVAPPFVVPMMLGFGPDAEVLKAWQIEGLAHETLVSKPIPFGSAPVDQLDPPLVVRIASGLPKMPNPTATQSDAVGQEVPFRPLTWVGMFCEFQVKPWLEEDRAEFTPATKQLLMLGHEAELRRLVPDGRVSTVQELPAVVVLMIVDPAPVLPLFPTATQSLLLEQVVPVMLTASLGAESAVHVLPPSAD